jgi:hypothetical protein
MSVTNRPGSSARSDRHDTEVTLVLTRLDTAAMNLFLARPSQAVAPGAHGIVLMDKAGSLPLVIGCARKPQARIPAALLARTEHDRAAVAPSSRQSPFALRLPHHR